MNKMAQARRFIEAIPHAKALGMRLETIGEGEVEMRMDYNEKFIGDPQTQVIHGEAVFALLDSCCGAAVLSHPDQRGLTAATDLRIDYMRPAMPHQTIRAIATCYNVTRSVAFVRAVALDENAEKTVAMASGAFVNLA